MFNKNNVIERQLFPSFAKFSSGCFLIIDNFAVNKFEVWKQQLQLRLA